MDVFGIDVGGSGIKGAPVDTETGTLRRAHPRKDPKDCDTRGRRRDDGGCGQEIRGKDAEHRSADSAQARGPWLGEYAARLDEDLFWPDPIVIGGGSARRARSS